jgi:hypothetical protein
MKVVHKRSLSKLRWGTGKRPSAQDLLRDASALLAMLGAEFDGEN